MDANGHVILTQSEPGGLPIVAYSKFPSGLHNDCFEQLCRIGLLHLYTNVFGVTPQWNLKNPYIMPLSLVFFGYNFSTHPGQCLGLVFSGKVSQL